MKLIHLCLTAVALAFASPTVADAQVLIYKLEFQHEAGFNVEFFKEGYCVVPVLGGTGSILLGHEEDGRRIANTAADSANFFTGITGSGRRVTVLNAGGSAATTGATATSATTQAWVATGDVNKYVSLSTPTSSMRVRIASSLKGLAIGASAETGSVTAADGSLGFAHIAEIKASLDDRLTSDANKAGETLAAAVTRVQRELFRRGYVTPTETDPDTPTDPTTPTTPTTPDPNTTVDPEVTTDPEATN